MNYEVIVSTKDNNFNFYQVFLNTLDSKQLSSFLHLNKISATISEKSFSILLAKASFAFLLISMLSYWFQMSFKSQILMSIDWETIKALIFSKKIHYSKKKASTFNRTDKKEKVYSFVSYIPLVSMWSANITLAFLLFIRWIESGHFPLSNLYESLLFLSWSLTVIHLFLENVFYKKEHILCSLPYRSASASTLTLGAITSPVALFTNAFATFSLPQEMQKVTVLVPALKSNWLIMHVSVMIISYAALLSGSLLAMAFLVIKFIDDNKVPSILTTFINYVSSLTQLIERGLRGKKIYHASSYSSSLLPTISAASDSLSSNSEKYKFSATDPVGVKVVHGKEHERGMVYLEEDMILRQQEVCLLSKHEVCFEEDLFGEGSKTLLLKSLTKENKVLMDLPEILDNLSYRSIGLGFALLTMGILSGAVWANEAWGSYWNWDPKETWALITWLVFALYLHTRLSKGWVGKESAFVASFGFIVIWFCYLGVNLFGKGLHSYGWFQQ